MTPLSEDSHHDLVAIFLSNVPDARRSRFASVPDLQRFLVELIARGRAVWAGIPLPSADFVAFLGRTLPEQAAEELGALKGDDLWLACAYGRGLPGAVEALEACGFGTISKTLARIGAAPSMIADVLQELRSLLVEMQFPARDKKLYAGRGDLVGWLRISAVRELNLRRNRSARELSLETHAVLDASSEQEPEVALLLKMHKQELTEAFRQALASMSSRERNVLRYHFVEKVSIDQIGALYSVHRSTAARWISRAREALCMRTRAFFRERISMSDEGFQRVVALIESQIQVELARAASLTR